MDIREQLVQKFGGEVQQDQPQENIVDLTGDVRDQFSQAAREATWERMVSQMSRHPMGLKHYDTLVEKFNKLD